MSTTAFHALEHSISTEFNLKHTSAPDKAQENWKVLPPQRSHFSREKKHNLQNPTQLIYPEQLVLSRGDQSVAPPPPLGNEERTQLAIKQEIKAYTGGD